MAKRVKDDKQEQPVEVPQKPSIIQKYIQSPKYNFYVKTLKELAIPYAALEFKCKRDGIPSTGLYMTPDDFGNIRFYTPSFDGDMETYATNTANVKEHDWYLTRFQEPKKTKDGNFAKYMPVQGGGTRLLFTPNVLEAFKDKTEIDTLYLIEGFKKALSIWYHGQLPVIGMNGLSGFKEPAKDKIRAELKEFLIGCKVKRVALIDDSDLFDLGNDRTEAETLRPNNFYRAAISAKALIEPFSDVILIHPKPNFLEPEKKYGFDDLLFEQRGNDFCNDDLHRTDRKPDLGRDAVIQDLLKITKEDSSLFFQKLRLSSVADHKIRAYFFLDDVNSFYNHHINKLKPRNSFRFYTYKYRIKDDGTLEQVEEDETFGFKVKDGKIFCKPTKSNPTGLVSNFTWKILFHIKGNENLRVVELTNYLNEKTIIEINKDDLASPAKFVAQCIDQGNYIFFGGKDDLLKLSSMLMVHEKQAIVFNCLGYQPDHNVYAFSNGISTVDGWKECDEYGIVEHNDQFFYFPAFSKFNRDRRESFADLRRFAHIPSEKTYTFEQWKNQFTKVYSDRGRGNGEVAVCFYLASLFSDIVFDHRSGIGFPLLFGSGKPKTGKSTIFKSLMKLFGNKLEGETLSGSSTVKYLYTQFAKFRNGLVFLDEYSNDIAALFHFLKNVFDRRPYGTKQYSNDNRTREIHILSPAIVAGEVLPTGNHALFTRTISLMFNTSEDERSENEIAEFDKLMLMEEHGLTSITVNLVKHRHLIENNFNRVYSSVSKDIDNHFKGFVIDGRMKKSAKWILTVVRILIDEQVIDFGTSWKELLNIWADVLTAQNQQIQTNTDLAKFWEVIDFLVLNGLLSIDRGDFKFEGEYLVIRLNRFVLPYQKKAQELHYQKILDKPSLFNYLKNEPYFVPMLNEHGRPKQTRFAGSSSPFEAMYFNYFELSTAFDIDLTKKVFVLDEGQKGPEKPTEPTPETKPEAQQQAMNFSASAEPGEGIPDDLPF